MFGHFKSGYVALVQVMSGEYLLGCLKSGCVRLGQVMSTKYM
jgi:hypothetical protein